MLEPLRPLPQQTLRGPETPPIAGEPPVADGGAGALDPGAVDPGTLDEGADPDGTVELGDRLLGLVGDGVDWFVTNGVDGLGLVLAVMFALLGVWHGLWWQVVRFAGLLGAVLAARGLSPDLARWIEGRWSGVDPLIVGGAAWLVVFLAALSLAVFVGRLGKRLLEALELSALDRLGGLLAGLATGLLLHAAVVAVLLQLTPGAWSREHIVGTRSGALVELLGDRARVLFDQSTALALESRRDDERP